MKHFIPNLEVTGSSPVEVTIIFIKQKKYQFI